MIGRQDQASHQYDIRDFWAAAEHGNLPAVSYIKAPAYEDGHAVLGQACSRESSSRPSKRSSVLEVPIATIASPATSIVSAGGWG
jgi:phosphoesterase family protein